MPNKFLGVHSPDGRNLHWGRVDLDGAPFRGNTAPLLRGDDADALLEKTFDTFCATFDTSQPQQEYYGHTLARILDGESNNWYQIRSWSERWHEKPDGPVMYIFVVWSIPHMELKQDAPGLGGSFLNTGAAGT